MTVKEFLEFILDDMDEDIYEMLRDKLTNGYLQFSYVEKSEVTKGFMLEKLHDYFDKVELKTGDRIPVILCKYMSEWKILVARRIIKEEKDKDGNKSITRAKKYYDYASEIRYAKDITLEQQVDFSRIVFSLYMAEINEKKQGITNFDYSVDVINIDRILQSLKTEETDMKIGKKKMLNITSKYGTDMCTMVLTILFYFYIKNNELKGEY